MQQQQPVMEQVASRDLKAELTCALKNSSDHHIQARHSLIVVVMPDNSSKALKTARSTRLARSSSLNTPGFVLRSLLLTFMWVIRAP